MTIRATFWLSIWPERRSVEGCGVLLSCVARVLNPCTGWRKLRAWARLPGASTLAVSAVSGLRLPNAAMI
jgi:hypothetical protein